MSALLEIEHLSVGIDAGGARVRAVDDVSLRVDVGQRVGIIGESGSGKSITGLSVLQLHDARRTHFGTQSSIKFDGEELLGRSFRRIRALRGTEISMVFQDPMAALNPVFTIGRQLGDVARKRLALPRDRITPTLIEALEAVEIRAPEQQLRRYPHQLSGGMRQRVLIAMALLCEPRLVIADEPTSALDVTVQAAVLETIKSLANEHNSAVLLITHDMGVVARFCEFVHVMYGGRIVESGTVANVFGHPRHPYTAALLRCTPRIDGDRRGRLEPIPGTQSTRLGDTALDACPFAPRCNHAREICRNRAPVLEPVAASGQLAACHRKEDVDLRTEVRPGPTPGADRVPA